jgi:hypothetical protein
MKKSNLLALCMLLFFSFGVKAQMVSTTTEYDTPEKNTWNGAVFTGLDIQSNSGGLYLGLNGRYTLGKIATFSTNLAYDYTRIAGSGSFVSFDEELLSNLPAYKNFEFRGAFHFKDVETTAETKVKLGRGVNSSGKAVKWSVQQETKARNVYAITASVNIQSRIAGQPEETQVIYVQDAAGNDLGFVKEIAVGQNNLVLGAGLQLGQYTWFKGDFSGLGKTKTRKIKKSLVSNFELLYAFAIGEGDVAYYKKDVNSPLQTYTLTSVDKKRLGFRLSTDYSKNKPGFFQRMELGYRPGIAAPSANSKWLNQGYVVYAVGIGF